MLRLLVPGRMRGGIAWFLMFAACVVDARSIDAGLLIFRCIAGMGLWAPDWSIWGDHMMAFPLTSLAMTIFCLAGTHGNSEWSLSEALWKTGLMAVAMVPACSVAGWTIALFKPLWAAETYAVTMVVVSMFSAKAAEWIFARWPSVMLSVPHQVASEPRAPTAGRPAIRSLPGS